MHIVHIGKYYPPDRGGMESFLQVLARAQVQSGHTVDVLAHTVGSKEKHSTKSELHVNTETRTKTGITIDCGVSVRRFKVAFNVGSYAPVAPMLALYSLSKLLWDSDIIHVHSPNVAAIYSLFAFRRPVILHWHSDVVFSEKSQNISEPDMATTHAAADIVPARQQSTENVPQSTKNVPQPTKNVPQPTKNVPQSTKNVPDWMIKAWRLLEKLCLSKAASIVVTSQAYLDSSEFLQPYRHKCRVIPLALGVAIEPDYNSPAIHFLQDKGFFPVLAVGRLSHYKGFDILIKALVSVPQMRLCLVGLGECEASLRQLVRECGLRERVFFAGDISDAVLRACYQSCQCFVLPSILRTEAFGMVILEAMREAKACIVSNVAGSGMTTVIKHEKTGLLYKSGDVPALVQALQRLAADENLCMRMGQAGYERWKSKYNIDSVCAATDDIYMMHL